MSPERRDFREIPAIARTLMDKKERSSNRASSSDSSPLENHRREEENHLGGARVTA